MAASNRAAASLGEAGKGVAGRSGSWLLMRAASALRSATACWCALRCELTKRSCASGTALQVTGGSRLRQHLDRDRGVGGGVAEPAARE
eukprot:5226194-Pleurochrysis_carterae.AAC.2